MPRVLIEVVGGGGGVKNISTLRPNKIPKSSGEMMSIGRGRLHMHLLVLDTVEHNTSSTHWRVRLSGCGDDVSKLQAVGWQPFIPERRH